MNENDYNILFNYACKNKKCKHGYTVLWKREKKQLANVVSFPFGIAKRVLCAHCGNIIGAKNYAYCCNKCKWAWVCKKCSKILNDSRKKKKDDDGDENEDDWGEE